MKIKRKPAPMLRSMPVTDKMSLPPRSEIIPQIESGALDHIDFKARVYRTDTKIRNPYKFPEHSLAAFAASFEGQPFLRNHDTYDIDARDGTIIESQLEGDAFEQTVRLTTRRGMLDFVEGKIDRFSIGWFYDDILCSICGQSWLYECYQHQPGKSYKVGEAKKETMCELIFTNPSGKETSAVNAPAVDGTGIDSMLKELQQFKLEVSGENERRSPHAPRVHSLLKGANLMKVRVRRNGMIIEVNEADVLATDEIIASSASDERTAALELQGASETIAQLREQQQESNALLIAQCASLLDSALAAARLPLASAKAVRKPFELMLAAGHPFKATELQEAIADKKAELSEIASSSTVEGPGRASGFGSMFTGRDQFIAAYADLLGAPRPEGLEKVRAPRLSGIREAYILGTGDINFYGGYYNEFALAASVDFPGVTADLLNKMLTNAWEDYKDVYGWWSKIATVEHFSNLNDVKWVKTGTIGSLPTVAERGEYTQLTIGDNKESSSWQKYGGYIAITLEDMLKDDIRALQRLPKEAALGGMRNISEQVAAIFTSNSAVGPTMADGGALFNATAVTSAGGHKNLLTTALGTDYTAWNAVALAVFNQPLLVKSTVYGTGKKQALDPRFCLIPRDLKSAAEALFIPRWEAQAQNVAPVSATWGGRVEPVVVPEWTDATDWAAAVDPKYVPGVMLGEIFGVKPQIFKAGNESDPAMFANDESRIKVRQFLTVGVADWRALHKSNV